MGGNNTMNGTVSRIHKSPSDAAGNQDKGSVGVMRFGLHTAESAYAHCVRDIAFKSSRISNFTQHLESLGKRHRSLLTHCKDSETNLHTQFRRVTVCIKSLTEELESVEYCNTELQVTAPGLRTNLDNTKRIIESYNRKQKHLINLYNRRRGDVNHMLRETRCNYWASNLQCLNTLLGCTLCSEGDTLVVTFTHLGASNPTKRAFVTLSANKDIFEGISCVPMIRQFNALISQVNEGVAFGLFVCNIRKEFKASFP